MLNKDQANHANEQLYNDAVQEEIRAILSQDGPLQCGQIARRLGKSPHETRWHLEQMDSRCEVNYNWIRGYSV